MRSGHPASQADGWSGKAPNFGTPLALSTSNCPRKARRLEDTFHSVDLGSQDVMRTARLPAGALRPAATSAAAAGNREAQRRGVPSAGSRPSCSPAPPDGSGSAAVPPASRNTEPTPRPCDRRVEDVVGDPLLVGVRDNHLDRVVLQTLRLVDRHRVGDLDRHQRVALVVIVVRVRQLEDVELDGRAPTQRGRVTSTSLSVTSRSSSTSNVMRPGTRSMPMIVPLRLLKITGRNRSVSLNSTGSPAL